MKKIILVLSLLLFQGSILFSQSGIITTSAGNFTKGGSYSGDGGPATAAGFFEPFGLVVDGNNNLYIADFFNNAVRKVDITGIITTYAGNGYHHGSGLGGYSGDGGPATAAELYDPEGIALDSHGNLYIADASNMVIRMVNTSGIITTVAGRNSALGGYSGDGGPATAAELSNPMGVAFDTSGNLYIADASNNVIRMVNTTGIISTVVGNYNYGHGYSGDGGPATSAELWGTAGLTIDKSGNIYIADQTNCVIRKVDNVGIISTIAGNNSFGLGFSGDGGPATAAELHYPVCLTLDALGNLYIADNENEVIRKVDTYGIISTIAGRGPTFTGYSGDGGPATASELGDPSGLAFDAFGNLYIADWLNCVVRKISPVITGINQPSNSPQLSIYPNPAQNVIYVQLQGGAKAELVEVYSITGQEVQTSSCPSPIPCPSRGTYTL